MDNCIFCKIVRKEIPAEIVYEDEQCLAFLDIAPIHEGHLLLIPKEHHEQMTDTPDSLVAHLFIKAKKLVPTLKQAMQADFVVTSVVGIDVPHFHIHLMPRYTNDGLTGWPTKKYETLEKMKEVGDKIRASFTDN